MQMELHTAPVCAPCQRIDESIEHLFSCDFTVAVYQQMLDEILHIQGWSLTSGVAAPYPRLQIF